MLAIKFHDETLQRQYDRSLSLITARSEGQRAILALIETLDWFQAIEGHSARTAEVIEALLLPQLRPALRQWYVDGGNDMSADAMNLRDRLSSLAGEQFGPTA